MLSARQNFLEAVKGGKPDRFVNQYEAIAMCFHPAMMQSNSAIVKGGDNVVNAWGVTISYPDNAPGPFPVHTPDKIVVKNIKEWKEYVKSPSLEFTGEEWGRYKSMYDSIDGEKYVRSVFVAPGVFEQVHYLCSMTDALLYYMTDQEDMHDLVKYITDWELKLAEDICSYIHPESILHHDDWGSSRNSFLSPEMFEDFFLEPYKQIYGYYHGHGVDVIIHHSDSYAANLVPDMIEMGVDVWQGCLQSNDLKAMQEKYAGKIAFMGGIDNQLVDFKYWTKENNRQVVQELLKDSEPKGFIPCITQGGPGAVYPGVYESLMEEVDAYNAERFDLDLEELKKQRPARNCHETA